MIGCVKAVLRKTVLTSLAVIFSFAFLPGCAVVGPLLSMGGMIGVAPLQYASTAYTVGEFTYHYAANDKDPGEVIEDKINNILSGEAFMLPDHVPGYDSPERKGEIMTAEADVPQETVVAANSIEPNAAAETALPSRPVGNVSISCWGVGRFSLNDLNCGAWPFSRQRVAVI